MGKIFHLCLGHPLYVKIFSGGFLGLNLSVSIFLKKFSRKNLAQKNGALLKPLFYIIKIYLFNMKGYIKKLLRETLLNGGLLEDINIPVNVGDEILTGKFKNKKTKIKSIDKNEKGDLTINDKPALKFRIPNEKIEETLVNEEYDGHNLFGYHVTSMSNLDSIKSGGLKAGHRAMQGGGLYGFYDYDHALRYARKGEINNPIIVKFYITSPHRFLYLNMDIAKAVLGPNDYHLINQVDDYFYGNFNEFFGEVKKANPSMTEDKLRGILKSIEDDNSEMSQRTFVFSLIPSTLNDKLNIVWNGNYGLEFRISNTRYVKVIGYDVPNFHGGDKQEVIFSVLDSIPEDSKYDMLRDFFNNNSKYDTFAKAYAFADNMLSNVRNNREYDYYQKIVDLLDTLK